MAGAAQRKEARVDFGRRIIEADFSGGELSSDGGLMLRRQAPPRARVRKADSAIAVLSPTRRQTTG